MARISWQVWCCMVMVMVTATTTRGAAVEKGKTANPCASEEVCVPASECTPMQQAEESKRKDFKECGRDKDKGLLVCCPKGEKPQTDSPEEEASGEDLLPKNDECGLRPETVYRIMFGEEAPLNAYPWLALLGYKNPSNPQWLCGGALINDLYVVTAGHCLEDNSRRESKLGELVAVRLGEHNVATNLDCPEGSTTGCSPPQDFIPEEVLWHKDFHKRGIISDDIGLIRLDKKAKMGPSVQPLCLPPADLDVEEFLGSRDALIAGWGKTEAVQTSKILMVAEVPLASMSKCNILYPFPLLNEQLCFGGRGKVDSCFGDSGGPVFQADPENYHHTMLGIVSFGMPKCGLPGVPAIYTKASSYRDWIVDRLKP